MHEEYYDFSDLDDVDDISEVIASQNWPPHMQLAYLAYCQGTRLAPRVAEFPDHLLQRAIDEDVAPDYLLAYLTCD